MLLNTICNEFNCTQLIVTDEKCDCYVCDCDSKKFHSGIWQISNSSFKSSIEANRKFKKMFARKKHCMGNKKMVFEYHPKA